MPVSLTRTVTFQAIHRYYRSDWSEEQNRKAFGPLADPPGHGHDYQCAVTVTASPDQAMGTVMDLGLLDRIVGEEVVQPFAGKRLNDVAPFSSGTMLPTCEAIAVEVFRRIARRLPEQVKLERVRIAEDPTLYADCTGLT
jgi:6-pyruvoyltetrahydropterin/6-carboxytetrahydropterin synthase